MTSISNGEAGSSVRTKLNAALLQSDAMQMGTRAALVALGSYTNNAVYHDGTHWYKGSTGATAISDMAGLVPLPPYHLEQWGVVLETNTGQKTSSEDNATAIQAAIDWLQANGGGDLFCGKGVIAFGSTIYQGDGSFPVMLKGEGRGITGGGKTNVRQSAGTRFLWTGSAAVKKWVLTSDRANGGTKARGGGGGVVDAMFDGAEIGTAGTSIPSSDVFGTTSANGGWLFNVISHSGHELKIHLAYCPGGHFLSTCLSNGLATGPADTQRGIWDIWTSDANTTAEPYAQVLITGDSGQSANTSLMESVTMTLRPESTAIAAHIEFSDGSFFPYIDAACRATASGDGGKIILHADDTLTTYHSGAYTSQGHCRRHTFAHVQSKSELDALATLAGSNSSGPNTIHTWSRGNGAARPRVSTGAVLNYWDENEGIAAPGWLSKATRAELVTFCANYTPIPGARYSDGVVEYVGSTGATVYSDLPGLIPFGFDSPRHHGAVGDGPTNDATAVQAAMNSAYPVRMKRGDVYKCGAAITYPSNKYVDFNGAKLVRDFQDGWLFGNSTGLTTNNNSDVTLIDPWLEDDGTTDTRGPFLLASGVDTMTIVRPKVRGTSGVSGTIAGWGVYVEGTDVTITDPDIDTSSCGLYGDGVHVGHAPNFRMTGGRIDAGDDAIALQFPSSGYAITGTAGTSSNIAIDGVKVSSATANGIRIGAADDGGASSAGAAARWENVRVSNIVFGACDGHCIRLEDLRISAEITAAHDNIKLSGMDFGDNANTRLISLLGNPDITDSANYAQHNYGRVVFVDCDGQQTEANGQLFYGGGADVVELRGCRLTQSLASAASTNPLDFRQIDRVELIGCHFDTDASSNILALNYALATYVRDTIFTDSHSTGCFRCINFALNNDQASSLYIFGGGIHNTLRGIDDTGTGAITDFVVVGTDIDASTATYVLATTPGGADVRLDRKRLAYSSGTTGGAGSAGAGNQYVEMAVNGTTYKVLHDGTV